MKREVEALLFATDSPLTLGRLRKLLPEAGAAELKDAVAALQDEYARADHAFTIVEFGGGWQIATRPEYAPLVERLISTRRHVRLSRAGLEVLAIVAYRQPTTRLEIDEIRGVQSSAALATLQERGLVAVVGRSDAVGHPLLYGTTREFLNHLGLSGLAQLPGLPSLQDIAGNREDLMALAGTFGQDISEEDLSSYCRTDADGDPEAEPHLAPSSDEAPPGSEDDLDATAEPQP